MAATRLLSLAASAALAITLTAGCGGGEKAAGGTDGAPAQAATPSKITINIDPIGKAYDLMKVMAVEYEKDTGIKIEIIAGPKEATERLSQYLQYLGSRSTETDVYQIDVIWPGTLSEHFIDLNPYFKDDVSDFFPAIVQNNTVDGRLLGIPWFADAGMLYYRTDLLEKYGYDGPPATWAELDAMATKVMEGERAAGNPDFWGFVWQGKGYEGLTCNAIEWVASCGGGTIVDSSGKVTINNPNAIAAVDAAASWVGRLSPPGVTTYAEEECRQLFQQGNALFMRNWPYAYSLANGEGSAIAGKFDVTVLPSGAEGGPGAAALGGWQLGVSKYSKNQAAAAEFVRWLTSEEIQKRRAIEAGLLATRVSLYDDADIAAAIPFFPSMKDVFMNATPRPSTATGEDYNQVSTLFFRGVHKVLTGQSNAAAELADLEAQLNRLLK
jgi:trehalose/maltose transport system substrate-binding protein